MKRLKEIGISLLIKIFVKIYLYYNVIYGICVCVLKLEIKFFFKGLFFLKNNNI